MKPVLVSQRLVRADTGETRDALDAEWGRFLAAAGFVAVPVASGAPVDALIAAVRPAGLVLSGGNDLAVVSDDPLSAARDALETRLLDWADAAGAPVVGVCRGLQVLAVRHGLSLAAVDGHVRATHALAVEPGSRWFGGYGGVAVNSYHRYSPVGTAPGLRVAARAADGAIEAVEVADRPVVGLGWHPEREARWRDLDLELFRRVLSGRAADR